MYGPDSYLYATNLSLLATLSDEELADPALIAQLTPGTTALTSLGRALADAIWQGLAALGEAFAPTAYPAEQSEAAWLYLPVVETLGEPGTGREEQSAQVENSSQSRHTSPTIYILSPWYNSGLQIRRDHVKAPPCPQRTIGSLACRHTRGQPASRLRAHILLPEPPLTKTRPIPLAR